MIFAKTIDLVLSGRKTCTTRLAYEGDWLAMLGQVATVYTSQPDGRCRWRTGKTLAVQRQRARKAEGRILITGLHEIINPLEVDDEHIYAEGFNDRAEYLRIWHELHGDNPIQRCWAISFRLVAP